MEIVVDKENVRIVEWENPQDDFVDSRIKVSSQEIPEKEREGYFIEGVYPTGSCAINYREDYPEVRIPGLGKRELRKRYETYRKSLGQNKTPEISAIV